MLWVTSVQTYLEMATLNCGLDGNIKDVQLENLESNPKQVETAPIFTTITVVFHW